MDPRERSTIRNRFVHRGRNFNDRRSVVRDARGGTRMRTKYGVATLALLLIGMGLSWATPKPPRQPPPDPPQAGFTVSSFIATPTINFALTDPDTNPGGGTGSTTVSWTVNNGYGVNWKLYVYATFTSCSANYGGNLKVSCTGATHSRILATNTCVSGAQVVPSSASAPGLQISSGTSGLLAGPFSNTLQYTLADNWRYVASSSCAINLTYTIQGQ
jgi:hypothetical protein